MKRFWLVLLSLGLVLAFSAQAFAVDVKFSGSFYAAGMYLDKTSFNKDSYTISSTSTQNPGISTAFYYQRLRVGTEFIVSPGLKLVTRFDALERIWGGARGTTPDPITAAADSAGTRAENENIAVDWAYIDYVSPIGTFDVGIMNYGATGTIFGNGSYPAGRIKYSYTIGPATINADITKVLDKSYSAVTTTSNFTDADNDAYAIEGVYKWKDGLAAMKVIYYNYAGTRPAANNYAKKYFLFTPYAIAKIGPVALQAEFNYATGDLKNYDNGTANVSLKNISGWIDATATFAPVYFGGTFAYISGDDLTTSDKQEGGTLTGGIDWNPCLIMFNQDITYWAGAINGYSGTFNNSSPMGGSAATGTPGAWFGQGRVGVNPLAALDIMASLSYAKADQQNASLKADFGWEIDVTGTYKLTNNLSYMLGVGYLFTGDYYKGTSNANRISDDYMLINKLTLTF